MGATVFYEGSAELATLTNTFTVNGVATNPTTVTLVVTDPAGASTTYNTGDLTNPSTGVYSKNTPCTAAGLWTYVWTGTGTASDVIAGSWRVEQTSYSDLYCTPEQLKSRTGISDNYDDAEILSACRSVSRWIDEHCDRVFARRTATVVLEACVWSVETPDLVSVTTLKTDDDGDGTFETTWSAADYELQPVGSATQLEARPYTVIAAVGSRLFPVSYGRAARRGRVELAAVLGWPALPAAVQEAAAIVTGDYLALGGMKFGIGGYGDYGPIRARMSTPALQMLAPYRRYPILMG